MGPGMGHSTECTDHNLQVALRIYANLINHVLVPILHSVLLDSSVNKLQSLAHKAGIEA